MNKIKLTLSCFLGFLITSCKPRDFNDASQTEKIVEKGDNKVTCKIAYKDWSAGNITGNSVGLPVLFTTSTYVYAIECIENDGMVRKTQATILIGEYKEGDDVTALLNSGKAPLLDFNPHDPYFDFRLHKTGKVVGLPNYRNPYPSNAVFCKKWENRSDNAKKLEKKFRVLEDTCTLNIDHGKKIVRIDPT